MIHKILAISLLLPVLLTGCAIDGLQMGTVSMSPADAGTNARVLGPADLEGRNGTLLSAIESFVPSARVTPSINCPSVELRGTRIQDAANPRIYVNGQPAMNTCILESLAVHDVKSVEVYPMGVPNRPGYAASAHGVILVFLR